jgi:type I restriction enzyme S subunit
MTSIADASAGWASSVRSDWTVATCGTVCREIVVGIVVKPTQYYAESGVPVLRSLNVKEGYIDTSDIRYMTETSHSALPKSATVPGDVVTVRTGSPGTTAVVPAELPAANCVDIIVSRPGNEILSEYLALWVNSPFGKDQILSRQGGLAQQHFNISEMKKLSIAFPSWAEQRRIVDTYACYKSRIDTNRRSLQKLRKIKQGLMEDLLTWRVRVEGA